MPTKAPVYKAKEYLGKKIEPIIPIKLAAMIEPWLKYMFKK